MRTIDHSYLPTASPLIKLYSSLIIIFIYENRFIKNQKVCVYVSSRILNCCLFGIQGIEKLLSAPYLINTLPNHNVYFGKVLGTIVIYDLRPTRLHTTMD